MNTHSCWFLGSVSTRHMTSWVCIGMLLGGCSTTSTSTSVRSAPAEPTHQLRLIRPDLAPLSATWHQEGRSLVGQLAFTAACQAETRQVIRREQITETRPNKSYYTGAYIAGAIVTMVGIGLVASSAGKSDTVSCGSGSTPRDGDKCTSEAGAWRSAGALVIATGLGTVLGGVIVQARKPQVETARLPSEFRIAVEPKAHACGRLESLENMVIAVDLSDGGQWSGRVDSQGGVRIDLGANANLRGAQTARFSVDAVPQTAESFATVGLALGELSLTPTPRKLAAR